VGCGLAGAFVPAGCGGIVVAAAGDEATAAALVAAIVGEATAGLSLGATPGVGEAG